jgi:hypothetical protein
VEAVSLDDWILSLHVLSAFAMVGALLLFWVLVVVIRDIDTVSGTLAYAPAMTVGNQVIGVGILGTVLTGIWLAISRDAYQLWDAWIVAALVLWAIAAGVGGRGGKEYSKALERASELEQAGREGEPGELRALNRSQLGFQLHAASSVATLLILALMIWKPGA